MWEELRVTEPIGARFVLLQFITLSKGEKNIEIISVSFFYLNQYLLIYDNDLFSFSHPFISILSISKGKKLLSRVIRHCSPDQILSMLNVLVANFGSMDVCRDAASVIGLNNYNKVEGDSLLRSNQEIELFMNTVVPSMLGFVSNAPFRIIIALMKIFLEKNNVEYVARSKVRVIYFNSNSITAYSLIINFSHSLY